MGEAEKKRDPNVIGRYEVRRRLGSGGMGVVFAAHDPELDREVAVKLLRAERLRLNSEAASARLRREAQITARLAHPNVVTIYDVGGHGDGLYIAMELVDGPSLHRWMNDHARTWREVMAMFFQAGLGLAAAHDAGLIHRDFKPSNVLVGDRRARVVDFGLARSGTVPAAEAPERASDAMATAPSQRRRRVTLIPTDDPDVSTTIEDAADSVSAGDLSSVVSTSHGSLAADDSLQAPITLEGEGPTTVESNVTSTGLFVGTPAYMAPELFTGGGADARTDQFAFSVSLFEGLYGFRPFAGETAGAIADEVLANRVREAPQRTRVPGWLRNIIVKGLAIDPEDRHASIKAMLASIAFTSRIFWD